MSSPSSTSISSRDSPQSVASTTLSSPPGSPVKSGSILLNPLPTRRRPSVIVGTVETYTPAPPAHWVAENPSYPSSPPDGTVELRSRSSSAEGHSRSASPVQEMAEADRRGSLKFAPLPPGRKMYRSNSLSIGIAARAKMLQSQGGGTPVGQPRYAGPQQWYQSGGTVPPDVYTYKDLSKGLGKMWSKVKRRTSNSTAEAVVMERDSKGKGKEIQHIEEASDEDDEAIGSDSESDDERSGRQAVGLDLHGMGDGDSLSSTTSSQPRTPEDSVFMDHVPSVKGKEVPGRARVAF